MEKLENALAKTSQDASGVTEKLSGYALYCRIMEKRGLPALSEEKYLEAINAPKPVFGDLDFCIPKCPICHGLGRVRHNVPVDHPLFGRYTPCPNAPLESPVWNDCGLTVKERDYTWKTLKRRENKEAERSLEEAYRAIKTVLNKKSGLVTLTGANGLAKSLLLKIAVAETVRSSKSRLARYSSLAEIIEDMRMSYDAEEPGRSLREIERRYARFPVLSIDELGAERDTDFSEEKTFYLIDRRYNAAIENGEELVTILATNNSLADFPPRIADRLSDGRCSIVRLVGDSFRLGMKNE